MMEFYSAFTNTFRFLSMGLFKIKPFRRFKAKNSCQNGTNKPVYICASQCQIVGGGQFGHLS